MIDRNFYGDFGECSIEHAVNDANVPVCIFISKVLEGEAYYGEYEWNLTADNYMPRKNRVASEAYDVYSNDRGVLERIVKERILPLYRAAVTRLERIGEQDKNNTTCLYYWKLNEEGR